MSCDHETPPGGPGHLRNLHRSPLAIPAAAPPPPLRQGDRARARISRRPARHLRRAELPRPLRRYRTADQCLAGRLTPLGRPGLMDLWTTLRVAHNPTGPSTTAADI